VLSLSITGVLCRFMIYIYIYIYICMYVCMYVCIYMLHGWDEHVALAQKALKADF